MGSIYFLTFQFLRELLIHAETSPPPWRNNRIFWILLSVSRQILFSFLGKFSSELSRTLCHLSFRSVFYNLPTLRDFLDSTKDRILTKRRSGVYRLECADWSSVYIIETSHQYVSGVKSVIKPGELWTSESAFGDHLIEENHRFTDGSAVLLDHENNFRWRIVLEETKSFETLNMIM